MSTHESHLPSLAPKSSQEAYPAPYPMGKWSPYVPKVESLRLLWMDQQCATRAGLPSLQMPALYWRSLFSEETKEGNTKPDLLGMGGGGVQLQMIPIRLPHLLCTACAGSVLVPGHALPELAAGRRQRLKVNRNPAGQAQWWCLLCVPTGWGWGVRCRQALPEPPLVHNL